MFKGGGGGHISYNRYSTITISKHFAKAGKNKSSSAFHIACEQLNVYPGLKMHCYLRVWTPPPPIPVIPAGGPGRGDQKLTWSGHKQKCLSSYDRAKHNFRVATICWTEPPLCSSSTTVRGTLYAKQINWHKVVVMFMWVCIHFHSEGRLKETTVYNFLILCQHWPKIFSLLTWEKKKQTVVLVWKLN